VVTIPLAAVCAWAGYMLCMLAAPLIL